MWVSSKSESIKHMEPTIGLGLEPSRPRDSEAECNQAERESAGEILRAEREGPLPLDVALAENGADDRT